MYDYTTKQTQKKEEILSMVMDDNSLLETIYEPKTQKYQLILFQNSVVSKHEEYHDANNNITYLPKKADEIRLGIVTIPSEVGPSLTPENLFKEVQGFIKKYIDASDAELFLYTNYVMMTWVYDRFNKIPFLRILGQKGSGKSTVLKVLSSISYHSINLGTGNNTAPLFRVPDKFGGGTVIIDEANFRKSDNTSSLTQMLTDGYSRDSITFRCDPRTHEPKYFNLFFPRIFANHTYFQDPALESRLFTVVSKASTLKPFSESISSNYLWGEATELRNKLLRYRLEMFFQIKFEKTYPVLDAFDARIREITLPLLRCMNFQRVPKELIVMIGQTKRFNSVQNDFSLEGVVAESILKCLDHGLFTIDYSGFVETIPSTMRDKFSVRKITSALISFGAVRQRTNKGSCYNFSGVNHKLLEDMYGSEE